jgi:electron-transferring-flavoprotein dehydrogenase
VRNVKPLWSDFGFYGGLLLAGIDMWSRALLGGSPIPARRHRHPDFAKLKPLADVVPKTYPKPDGRVTFDRAASVFLANIAHDEDQPVHLRLADPAVPIRDNLPRYGEPAPLYCPAGVYEVDRGGTEGPAPALPMKGKVKEGAVFRIHAANCVHCKTCDIKDPAQNITWVPPEGGSGPNYSGM